MPKLFAVCTPGLERFTAREIEGLGLRIYSLSTPRGRAEGEGAEEGGVEFQGTLRDLYAANLHLRTASRILLRLGSFYTDTFADLHRRARRLPWESCFAPGDPVALRVTCHESRLYHSGAVGEKIAAATAERLGRQPPIEPWSDAAGPKSPRLVVVRLMQNRCTISVDSSGPLLHRRGYRLATAKAPLKETLAAAVVLASAWDLAHPLLDPFCGSGTIAIEAALLARNIPPGRNRRFAFMDWPGFDRSLWEALREEAQKAVKPLRTRIIASDRDAGAVEAARENAARAGVAKNVDFSCRAVSAIEPPPGPGWLVTNPPYGIRLGEKKDPRILYLRLGSVARQKCPGWSVAILCPSEKLLAGTGFHFDEKLRLLHGGVKVHLALGRVD